VVRVTMSRTHPVPDVCDYHARGDFFGLGPGIYPKAKAPRPPLHPFCRCHLASLPSRSAAGARPVPMAGTAFLRALPEGEASRIVGSRERLQAALMGADPVGLMDAGKAPQYRTIRLGDDAAGRHHMLED
jgi:hypothetical protein